MEMPVLLSTLVFLAGAGFLLYVLAGHPLLLRILSARRSRPIAKKAQSVPVTVLLPVHNGAKWIDAKLRTIRSLDYPQHLLRVLVLDDGSTDGTADLAARALQGQDEVIRLPKGGKAAALNAGIARATSDVLFMTDVRQRLAEDSLQQLVACLADPNVGVASGELVILKGESREEADIGRYWRYEKRIRQDLSALDSMLGATGCIYAIRRELAVPLPDGMLVDDMYLPLAAYRRGYRIVMDPSARAFDYPTKLEAEFHRKVRTLAGNYQIIRAYPELMIPWRRMGWHFLSYKVGRLLLPFAALITAAASLGLPDPVRLPVVAAEVGFLLAAGIDGWVPQEWRLKSATSVARTLLTMLAAAACALPAFLWSRERLWRQTEVSHAASL